MSTIKLNHLVSNKTQTQLTDTEMVATIGGNDFAQAQAAIELTGSFAQTASGIRNLFDPPQRPPTLGEQAVLISNNASRTGAQFNAQQVEMALGLLPLAMQLQP